jgi:hypothetical protein
LAKVTFDLLAETETVTEPMSHGRFIGSVKLDFEVDATLFGEALSEAQGMERQTALHAGCTFGA